MATLMRAPETIILSDQTMGQVGCRNLVFLEKAKKKVAATRRAKSITVRRSARR
jgi:hypothetical protein